jgi:hypothetical protein
MWARKDQHVMILSWYCPMCFKTRLGEASADRVRLDSPRIDKDQLRHSRAGASRIPVLDLSCPGDICPHRETCGVNCLVCGQSVFDGESPEYQVFRKVLEQGDTESKKGPKTLRAFEQICIREKVREALASKQAVMVGDWAMPVHGRCSQKRACGCVMPLGAESCPCKRPRFSVREPSPTPVQAGKRPEPCAAPVKPKGEPREKTRGAEGVLVSSGVSSGVGAIKGRGAVLTASVEIVRESGGGELCMPPVLKKPKPAPAKAAKPLPTGMRKLDGWMLPVAMPASAPSAAFSVREHLRRFDPDVHGYVLTKEGMCYRFPDGRFVRVYAGVNALHEDGTLTPCASAMPEDARHACISGSSSSI